MAVFDQTNRRTVYELAFERYGGLVVRIRKPSVRGWELLTRAIAVLGEDWNSTRQPLTIQVDAWKCLALAFADALIGWDLFDDGVAVPANAEGALAQDHPFLIDVATVWYRRVVLLIEQPAPTPAPEDGSSTNEDPDPEAVLASLPVTLLDAPPLPTGDAEPAMATSGG